MHRATRLTSPCPGSYLRLDGAMAQGVRQKVVRKFTTTDKSVILLASLKAGGVGLNLVCHALFLREVASPS